MNGVVLVKRLALLSKTKEMGEYYRGELLLIFGGYLDVTVIYDAYNQQEAERLIAEEYDMILVTNVYSFNKSRHLIKNNPTLIYLEFAFLKKPIERLKTFPIGTETLICLNYCSTSHQAASILYDVGVRNLNLYVSYPQNKNLEGKHITLALVSGGVNAEAEGIPQVFDLGDRKVALSTLLEIVMQAELLDDTIEKRIYEYREEIAVPGDYLDYSFNNSLIHKFQFQDIANCLEYPLIILDENHMIKNSNRAFQSMMSEPRPPKGPLAETRLQKELIQALMGAECLDNELVEVKSQNKGFLVSKEKLNKRDLHTNSYIVTIKDISHLRNLEANLGRQLKKLGHVTKYSFSDIRGTSPRLQEAIYIAKKIAAVDKPTLIIGESGTGKELFAQSMHAASPRNGFPFIAVNCAALPDTLLEAELFGYEDGAFTGARKGGRAGLFEQANHGTLFLDEIGDMPLMTQAKLLRALEEREVMKVGGGTIIAVDVRMIAATNKDLNALVREGKFRLDLFYRLSALMLSIPPLRERTGDILGLFGLFMEKNKATHLSVGAEVEDFLLTYPWDGNVRELRNCVEYMVSVCDGHIGLEQLPMYMKANMDRQRQQAPGIVPVELEEQDREVISVLTQGAVGRERLLKELQERGTPLTEYRLRGVLQKLERQGLVQVCRGRGGCRLTEAGIKAVQEGI